MYKCLYLFCCLVWCSVASTQPIDSVLSLKNDSTKLNLLKAATLAYCEDDPPLAIRFANAGITLARNLNNTLTKGEICKAAGVAYDVHGNLDSCLYYHNEAIAIFKQLGQKELLANTISDIALAYYLRGIYELSLRYHLEALAIREKLQNKKNISKSYNNIGLVYRGRKDFTNAIAYYKKSLLIKEEIKDSVGVLNTLMNIGSAYALSKKYDSAAIYSNQTLNLSRILKKPQDEINSQVNLAMALVGQKKFQQAEPLLNEALLKVKNKNFESHQTLYTIYESLGNLHFYQNRNDESIKWFKLGEELCKKTNRREMLAIFYADLSQSYELKGDYKTALQYEHLNKILNDSILNAENIRQINEMNAVYEKEKKEQQIVHLSNESSAKGVELGKTKSFLIYISIALLIFCILAFIAYRAFLNNRKKNQLLDKQKAIIQQQLNEKETLIREIHHRVKNNLQIISGLLNLQSRHIDNAEAQEAVREGRNRVKSMALIHQKLYQNDQLTVVNIGDYLQDLVQSIQQSFKNAKQEILVKITAKEIWLDVDAAIPIGLIINELVTNCYKYAFAGRDKGNISIAISEKEQQLQLTVADDGQGLPAGLDIHHTKSFGMKLIKSLADKLEATYQITNNNGACFHFTITNYKSTPNGEQH